MATVKAPRPRPQKLTGTVADLVERLGGIPLDRILLSPPPGTATEKNLIAALDGDDKCLCELIDGVLVEKAVGAAESILAGKIIQQLNNYLDENDLGEVLGADGPFRLTQTTRLPDVSFMRTKDLPASSVPKVIRGAPALAVEVLSESNTKKEIDRKLQELFEAGTELAWVIDPRTQTAEVYTEPGKPQKVGKTGTLDGGEVLPGFTQPLAKLFARRGKPPGKKPK
jgi:Uma2 family endonuclease